MCHECSIIMFKGLAAYYAQNISDVGKDEVVNIFYSTASVIEKIVKTNGFDEDQHKEIQEGAKKLKKLQVPKIKKIK
jgi:uncharacterized protein (DUF427 family)